MSEIDLIIKLRDAGQIIADACSEYLERQTPQNREAINEGPFNSLPWKDGEGAKGPYQSVKDDGTSLFDRLKGVLQQSSGRTFSQKPWAHYYWLGQEGNMIFRREKKRFQ